jgi:tetratricopeptide (TPR) repeat protein
MNCGRCGTLLLTGSAYCQACGMPVPRQVSGEEVSAESLLRKGVVLRQAGRFEEELAVYDEIICRFGNSFPAEAAQALLRKAARLAQIGEHQTAVAIYSEIMRRYERDQDLKIMNVVQQAANQMEYMRADDAEFALQKRKKAARVKLLRGCLYSCAVPLVLVIGVAAGVKGSWPWATSFFLGMGAVAMAWFPYSIIRGRRDSKSTSTIQPSVKDS